MSGYRSWPYGTGSPLTLCQDAGQNTSTTKGNTMDTASWQDKPTERPPLSVHRDWHWTARHAITGERAIQEATELAILLALADSIRPRTVIEVGTFAGGTAWAFAQLATVEHIITIDYAAEPDATARLADLRPQVSRVTYDSRDPNCFHNVSALVGPERADLLFIDGSHDLRSVESDYRTFAPLVRIGGLVALHDVERHNGQPDVEVHAFWDHLANYAVTTKITAAPGKWAGIGLVWK